MTEGKPFGVVLADYGAGNLRSLTSALQRAGAAPVVSLDPDAVESAARELAPHLVAFYLRELAAEFHSYYNATRLLVEDENVKRARLALAASVRQLLRNSLALLGVSAPDSM